MSVTLFYQNLTLLDFAYWDENEQLPLGESYYVDLKLHGHTDEENVIVDFSLGKKQIKDLIDDLADHRLAIAQHLVKEQDGYGVLEGRQIYYRAPLQAFCLLPDKTYSAQALKTYLEQQILSKLPKNIKSIELDFRQESLNSEDVSFQYIHGLKTHYGNCQRLFHGHSNTLKVWIDDQRNHQWEQKIVSLFPQNRIHFCFWENVQNKAELEPLISSQALAGPIGLIEKPLSVQISYLANQGEYQAQYPSEHLFVLPIESTVENISLCLKHYISLQGKIDLNRIRVQAFEGIGKGAIT